MRGIGMVADQPQREGKRVTPYMSPIASCLNTPLLSSRCSACFRELGNEYSQPELSEFVRYCSPSCASTDYPIHVSSGEEQLFILLKDDPKLWPEPDSTELRLALRFLHLVPSSHFTEEVFPDRIMGLLLSDFRTHHESVLGPMLVALARANTEGRVYDYCGDDELEMLAFDLVLTNATKVDYQGRYLGQALYDPRISWINHSCDPNATLVFKDYSKVEIEKPRRMLISPSDPQIQLKDVTDLGVENCCLRVVVKLNRDIAAGEEIKISYSDPYNLWSQEWKQSYLFHRYSFRCGCSVCVPIVPPALDSSTSSSLQSSCASSPTGAASNVGDLADFGGLGINCSTVVPHKLNTDESGSRNSIEDHNYASRSSMVDYDHSRGGTSEDTCYGMGENVCPLFMKTDMNTFSKRFPHPGASSHGEDDKSKSASSHGEDDKSKSKSKLKKLTSIFSPRGSFSRDT